jgi:aryl-alcohol dehydrogenase-like predicted oxidoreductase
MTFGEPGRGYPSWSIGEEGSRALIKHALEQGVNFFDTANGYSEGTSEEILGRALKDYGVRDELVIATKVRNRMRPGPNGFGLSRKEILAELDDSLRRLGVDFIDLYQIHRLDHSLPFTETLEALHDAVKVGKVRYVGACSMYAWEFSKLLALQTLHGWTRFISMQHHYNLLNREEEREMMPLCADAGIGTIIWSPLARGRLAQAPGATGARQASDRMADVLYGRDEESNTQIISALTSIAKARGISRAQVALAWLFQHRVVAAPLVGAASAAEIDQAVAALDVELSDDERAALEAPYTPRAMAQLGLSKEEEEALAAIDARNPIQ